MKRFGQVLLPLLLLLMFGCGEKTEVKTDQLTSRQEKILSYLPAETEFIMYMNLNHLRKTQFWENYFASVIEKNPESSWLGELEKRTGTGIKDGIVEFITTGSWKGNQASVVTFDKNLKKIKEYFNDKSVFETAKVSGKEVFKLKEAGSAKFYFADDSTLLIVNSGEYLNSLVKRGHKPLRDNKTLFPIIESIRHKQQYWAATDEGSYASILIESLVSSYKNLPAKNLIRSIKSITISAEFDEGVVIDSGWGCSDAKSAYLLSTAIKGALAMDLLAGKDEALNKVLQKMEVDQSEKNINFEINLTKNDLSDIKSFAKKNQLDKKL